MYGANLSADRRDLSVAPGHPATGAGNLRIDPMHRVSPEIESIGGGDISSLRETSAPKLDRTPMRAGGARPPVSPAVGWRSPQRRLAAVLVTDVFGFQRLLARDEGRTLLDLMRDRRERIEPAVHLHCGQIIKCLGDGMLVEFGSVIGAVECALEIQNARTGAARRMPLRIGINLCDVIPEGNDIYGDGVNVAFRVEGLAPPRGICITSSVYESIASQVSADFHDMGERHLKNISRSIHVFAWTQAPALDGTRVAPGPLSSTRQHSGFGLFG